MHNIILKKLRLIFFGIIFFGKFFSQDKMTDSLKLALKNARHDTMRCKILDYLIENGSDQKTQAIYNEQLRIICERNSKGNTKYKDIYLNFLAISISNSAYFEAINNNSTKAIEYYHKSLKIQKEIGNKSGMARTLINIGREYHDQGICSTALQYYEKSLLIYTELNDKVGIAFANYSMGMTLNTQGDIKKALDCFQISLKLSEELGNKREIIYTMNSIAIIYGLQGENDKALECFMKCYKMSKEINNKRGEAGALGNIGSIYSDRHDYPKALEYFKKSLQISEEIGSKREIAYYLNCIGVVFTNQKEYLKAVDYFNKYKSASEEINDNLGMAMALNNIASLNLKMGQLTEALKIGQQALQMDRKYGFVTEMIYAAKTVKEIYQKQKKHKEAFEMYELEVKMRDSINNDATQKASIKREMQYAYEKKELQAKTDQEKKDIIAKEELLQKERERNYFIVGFALVIILALFIFRSYRRKQKDNVLIVEQKKLVEEKQREIIDSIHYAQRIQRALITPEKYIDKKLNELVN